jgi:uncharacterized membrane protein (UPF0136 family)
MELSEMKITATIVGIYALILLIGGLVGYMKADSIPSLVSGLVFSVVLFLCAYAISKGKLAAQYVALAVTFVLDGFFTHRFAKTLNFIPSGLMSLLSLAVIIVIALKIRKTYKLR